MTQNFTKLMVFARKNVHLTQEKAAERIGISRQMIARYEQGIMPTDSVMSKMMEVYDSPALGWAYLSTQFATGRALLPELRIVGVSAGAIQLHITMKQAVNEFDRLERICADDVITPEEAVEYDDCLQTFKQLVGTIVSMALIKPQKKKSLTAATVRP